MDLAFRTAGGGEQRARIVVRATFTSDASLLALPPTEAAAAGAKAEMARLADQAARFQERGDLREARARLGTLNRIAQATAAALPARAREVKLSAEEYQSGVAEIDAPGSAASKKLKQKAFDALRAPVQGW